jgi:hypothetical protein
VHRSELFKESISFWLRVLHRVTVCTESMCTESSNLHKSSMHRVQSIAQSQNIVQIHTRLQSWKLVVRVTGFGF